MVDNNIDDETDLIANTILILAISVFFIAVILTPIFTSHLRVTIISISGSMILSFGYLIRSILKNFKQKKKALENDESYDST